MATLGVFNQVSWSGVGDVDECWIIATYWALVATGVMRREDLPSIRAFRAAAGRPDLPGLSGGNNRNLMTALRKLAPRADASLFNGSAASFTKALKSGYVASLSLLSRYLPSYLQFGFKGAHQVSVYYKGGKYYVMNPLAKSGSALIPVSLSTLQRASGALYGDRQLHAVLVKAKPGTSQQPKKKQRQLPPPLRDLPPPPAPREYMDGFASAAFYRDRHPTRRPLSD